MIHIVFNEADVKVLNEAIAMDESLSGEVIQIKDDYAVGPLYNIYVGEGMQARRDWWSDVLAGGDLDAGETMLELHRRLGEVRKGALGSVSDMLAAQAFSDKTGEHAKAFVQRVMHRRTRRFRQDGGTHQG